MANLPKKWEAIASDPAHFGGNRREAVERCYALHCKPMRELTDAEIVEKWSNLKPEFSYQRVKLQFARAIEAAVWAKQREPETVTVRLYRHNSGKFYAMVDDLPPPNEDGWKLVHTQTFEVKLP